MKQKEEVLKILKKYGFYSVNRAPYIYCNKNKIGVYFTWQNKHYGTINRVLFFDTEELLEEEVFKYWWYLTNKNKLEIDVELNEYESISPKITYIYENMPLSIEDMKKLSNKKDITVNKEEEILCKELSRTCNILINIFSTKIDNFKNNKIKAKELEKELNSLIKKNKKIKINDLEETYESFEEDENTFNNVLDSLESELTMLNSKERYSEFILKILEVIKSLDLNENNLKNNYLVNKYKLEIENIKSKIADSSSKEKKHLFKTKRDSIFSNSSDKNKLININLYIEKERKSIKEKYNNYENLNLVVLGDFIKEYEKLDLTLPPQIEAYNKDKLLNYKEVEDNLLVEFEKLNKKEKSACFIASSFLKPCLNILYSLNINDNLNANVIINKLITEGYLDMFNEAFKVLDNYVNTKIRVKYFNLLKLNDFKAFLLSLLNTIEILNSINIKIENSFYGYFNQIDDNIISIYLKNLYNIKNGLTYIGKFNPKSIIYFSPISITKEIDIIPNDELVIRESSSLFVLKNKLNIKIDEEIKSINYYEKDKSNLKNDYIVVGDILLKNVYKYYNCIIENKE